MNVIISNEQQAVLANLNIEIIKTVNGVYTADEIIDMFSNFFFGRMIFDVTALDGYKDPKNFQKISIALAVEKIILLLPNIPECNAPGYVSSLISMGFYNFTTNIDGVTYLMDNPNSYRDVAHLHQLSTPVPTLNQGGVTPSGEYYSGQSSIIAIKDLTEGAGATSLTYMLKKELSKMGYSVVAVEVNKRDFVYLNDKELVSTTTEGIAAELLKYRNTQVILIDANDFTNFDICSDVIYLFEPSYIRLNKLMMRDRRIFERLKGNKIILTKSLLSSSDVSQLEYEAKVKFFFTMPPLNDRANNSEILQDLLSKLGLVNFK